MAHRRAFTLIELLVVIAIIGVLAAILIPNLLNALSGTKESKTLFQMSSIEAPMGEFREKNPLGSMYPPEDADTNRFTTNLVQELTQKGLHSFKDDDLIEHPVTAANVMADAWRTPFKYMPWAGKADRAAGKNKTSYDFYSAGPDEEHRTADDLCNWSVKQLGAPDPSW